MHELNLADFCRRLLPFSNLSEDSLAAVLSASHRKSYQAKDYIFFEGSAGEAGYLIVTGRVAMVKASLNGREMIVELLPAGEFFGVVALLDQRPFSLTARAQSDAEILVIPRAAIAKVAATNQSVLQGFLAIVSQRLLTAHNVARSLAHDKVEVRIASALLALLGRDATSVEIGRQELADLTGTTIESASRVCKLWEREEILDLAVQGIVGVLNRQALESAARISE